MHDTKSTLAVISATALLMLALPSQASAWVCRADGIGASATARHVSITRAKIAALRACERRSLAHACTILYCR